MKRLFLIPYGPVDSCKKTFSLQEVSVLTPVIESLLEHHADDLTTIILCDRCPRAEYISKRITREIPSAIVPGEQSGYRLNELNIDASITPIRDLFNNTTNLILITHTDGVRRLANRLSSGLTGEQRLMRLTPKVEFGKGLCIDIQMPEPVIIG